MTDLWAEKPYSRKPGSLPYNIQVYDAEVMDPWLEKLKVEHDLLKEHSGRWLHFVAVDYPEIKESLSPQKLMELKEKAKKWNMVFGDIQRLGYVGTAEMLKSLKEKAELVAIYEKQYGNVTEYAIELEHKLEAVKELNKEYDARPIYELDLVQFHNFRAKLWKILEAE